MGGAVNPTGKTHEEFCDPRQGPQSQTLLRRIRTFVLLLAVFGVLETFGQRLRFPEDETAEEKYWKRQQQVEQQQRVSEEQWREQERQAVISALPQMMEAAKSIQPELIRREDGAIHEPPLPPLLKRFPDHFRLVSAIVLFGALVGVAYVRHKHAKEIRQLCGGYLSDGTEVAKYKLPEWFNPAPAVPTHEEYSLHANRSTRDAEISTPVTEFMAQAPARLAAIRSVLKEVSAMESPEQRQKLYEKSRALVAELRDKANVWELRPAWQMSSSLELLLRRLAEKTKDATPSAIRTVAAAMDILHEVCAPNIRPNLLTDPPLRIMAVDDDALCRRALQFALEKANIAPDLATNGEKAVELAKAHTYDVIFMDVQMPGMDGMAACSQIRNTPKNAETPVVFVTVLSDFATRAQSRLKGGTDLMAKPFSIFELAVKAMTLAMRRRLNYLTEGVTESETAPCATTKSALEKPALLIGDDVAGKPASVSAAPVTVLPGWGRAYFEQARSYLAETSTVFAKLGAEADESMRQKLLGEIESRMGVLAGQAKLAGLGASQRLAASLEKLAKRLHQSPKTVTNSTLHTLEGGAQMLAALCEPEAEHKIGNHAALKILVVEDDALARRAVAGALQLVFERPEMADSGALATKKISEQAYDVVFTDIEMPEMSGFEFCTRVRGSLANATTPVVFITSHQDAGTRERALASGGTDFITKPFLPLEIAVKALTLAWSSRLNAKPPLSQDQISRLPEQEAALSVEAEARAA